ncbi:ABC transporter ATP-binding protein [Peptacetobacter sp.]|uniref:ABC transporter ATP-binding protein n=1 Tax=Peptacetobacter sp. TaxID=2991975 RepID=UPI0029438477|nr:ABC transporter ATP-binding protein [Peptacetobacter sp.]MEE0452182.1 ABC transporter ATP-binding protein [Peptacetobacter sp.]
MIKNNFTDFWFFIIKSNKKKVIKVIVLSNIIIVLNLLMPQLIKNIINLVTLDKGIEIIKLIWIIIIYISIGSMIAILDANLLNSYTVIKKKTKIIIKMKILRKISEMSGEYYSSFKSGDVFKTIESDLAIIENYGIDFILPIIDNIITIIIASMISLIIQPDLFIFVIILQILMYVVQNRYSRKIELESINLRQIEGKDSNIIESYLSNIKNIVLCNLRIKWLLNIFAYEKEILQKNIKINKYVNFNILVCRIINVIIIASMYGIGGYKIKNDMMTVGDIFALQQYINIITNSGLSIITANTKAKQAKVSLNKVYSIMKLEGIKNLYKGIKLREKIEFDEIFLKNISFSYVNKGIEKKIFENASIKFKKNEITTIIGESGIGKSSIINILYKLCELKEGEILIDNINIDNINLNNLRKSISLVTQDIFIFNDSLRNNIDIKKILKDYEVIEICKKVGLDKFISSLDYGINTEIEENGSNISGGQKQKIAIARALSNDSEIFIFDEITSSLDKKSERQVLKTIKENLGDKIVIMIAHKDIVLEYSDKVYKIENKNIKRIK